MVLNRWTSFCLCDPKWTYIVFSANVVHCDLESAQINANLEYVHITINERTPFKSLKRMKIYEKTGTSTRFTWAAPYTSERVDHSLSSALEKHKTHFIWSMRFCKTPAQSVSRDCFVKEKNQPADSGKSEFLCAGKISLSLMISRGRLILRPVKLTFIVRKTNITVLIWTSGAWNQLWYCE